MSDVGVKVNITVGSESKASLKGASSDLDQILGLLKKLGSGGHTEPVAEGLDNVAKGAHKAAEASDDLAEKVSKTNRQLSYLESTLNRVVEGTKFLAGGFLGIEVIAKFKELADVAANTQRLGVALNSVAISSGKSQDAVDAADKAIQGLGYTADQSHQTLIKYIQANLDLSQASKLAAVAQNLSVSSNRSYTETFLELIQAVQSGREQQLKSLGLSVDLKKAQQDEANQYTHGSIPALNQIQLKQAAVNAVVAAGVANQDAFSDSLQTASGQLRELPNRIEKLKDTLGEALLPAYSAVVSVVTDLIKEFQLSADATDMTGAGAERLGDIVKGLMGYFKQGVEFLIAHKDAVLGVLGAYVLIEGVIRPLGSLFTGLVETISGFGEAFIGLGGITKYLSGILRSAQTFLVLTEALTGAETAEAALTAATGALDAAFVANPVGVVLLAVAAAVAVLTAGFVTFLAVEKALVPGATWTDVLFAGIFKVKEELRDLLALLEVVGGNFTRLGQIKWTSWKHAIKNERDAPKAGQNADGTIDATGRDFTSANRVTSADTTKEATNRYVQDIARARTADENLSNAKAGSDMAVLKTAEASEKTANARVAADKIAWDERIEGLHGGSVGRQEEMEKAANRAVAIEQQQQAIDYENARAELFKQGKAGAGGVLETSGFINAAANMRKMIDADPKQLADINDVKGQGREGAGALSTTEDLKVFESLVEELKVKYPAAIASLNDSLKVAHQKALVESRAFMSQVNADHLAVVRNEQDRLVEAAQNELDIEKEKNKTKLSLAKRAFEEGGISLDAYQKEQLASTEADFGKQRALLQANIVKAQAIRRATTDPNAKVAASDQVTAAQDAASRAESEHIDQIKIQTSDQLDEKIKLERQVLSLQNETLSKSSEEAGALAEITEKYIEQAETLGGVKGAVEAVAAAQKAARLEAEIDAANKQAAADLASDNAEVGTEKANVSSMLSHGRINENQASDSNDQIAEQQMSTILRQVADAKDQMQTWQDQKDALLAADPHAQTETLDQNIQALKTHTEELRASFIELGDSIGAAGKKLEDGFKADVAQGLNDALWNPKGATKAIQGIFTSFGKQITGEYLQNEVGKFTANLDAKYGKDVPDEIIDPDTKKQRVDASGNATTRHTTPFESLAKGLGLGKTEDPIGSEKRPSWTYIKNWPDDYLTGLQRRQTAGSGGGYPNLDESGGLSILPDYKSPSVAGPGGTAASARSSKGILGALSSVVSSAGASFHGITPDSALAAGSALKNFLFPSKSPASVLSGTNDPLGLNTPNLTDLLSSGPMPQLSPYVSPTVAADTMGSSTGDQADLDGSGGGAASLLGGINGNAIKNILGAFGVGGVTGGQLRGSGTGTSDSIPAMLSHGEFVTNAMSTSKYLPLLHSINNDSVHSISLPRSIAQYAAGGAVTTGGPQGGSGAPGNMMVQLHPDALNMSMSDWLNSEVTRQYANR